MNIKKNLSTYFPGIVIFLVAVIIGLLTYKDYGMSWDEHDQRLIGNINYDYAVHHTGDLHSFINKEYGAGFEMPLIFIERKMHITDSRDIYLMRHLVTHLFFLISTFFGYILIHRLFKNQFIACLGFFMLAFAPPIYAHSFFNTKDVPILSMFIICFTLLQAAFEERKSILFLLLGLACGYTTGIRVMGIMLGVFVVFFLMVDIIMDIKKKERPTKTIINILLFSSAFCLMLYASWPYLWGHPVDNFVKAYNKMAHFIWDSRVYLMGKYEWAQNLPYYYFPVWFMITNPILWLITGFAGTIWIIVDLCRKPLLFLQNTNYRNFIIYLGCFAAPIFAVIYLHSVIYDGWRHLYFIYPSFVLIALYFVNKLYQTKARLALQAASILQVAFIGYFMVESHPVQQVYFNRLVSHKSEYLRRNFDYEYWGASYLQALEYLVKKHPSGQIKLCYAAGGEPLTNNIMMLKASDRPRFEIVDYAQADYFITNFRLHPEDYPNDVEYVFAVQRSTAVCIYRTKH